MGLHPAIAAVRRGVRSVLEARDPAGPVLVACSGGADSLALLSATIFEGHKRGLRVVGVVVDHGLQADSAEVAARVVTQMAAMGVDETVSTRVTVAADGFGPEAAARQARYAVLEQVCAAFEADLVLLGHTRDDQAETVLLGLTRGSGGRSLAGMRPGFGPFARPLLELSREDTATACVVEGLTPWQDPHNQDPAYTRVRVRTRVLPVLEEELGPGVSAALARTADGLREDSGYLDEVAEQWFRDASSLGSSTNESAVVQERAQRESRHQLSVAALAELPPAIRHRVIRLAALEAGAIDAELFREHVLAVGALVSQWRGQKWVDLPGHVRARRTPSGVVVFERAPTA